MDGSFWHRKWERNEIAFHQREANPLLSTYFDDLSLAEGARVFVPLCGKTRDIHWLLSKRHRVAGAELSKIAVEQLFSELDVEPSITDLGEITRYSATNVDIFAGDIFCLSRELLGPVDAVYDRAALVAFPQSMRDRYAAHLIKITEFAPQLLIAFVYDQRLLEGPPFSVNDDEVGRLYHGSYDLTRRACVDVEGGLKGKCPAAEHVWLLKNNR